MIGAVISSGGVDEMEYQSFVDRIEGVKPSGSGHIGRCPAHEDKRQSLSVTPGDDGRILVKCHAGCEVRDIAAALNLSLVDLFPERDTRNGHARQTKSRAREVATYDYHDEHGDLLYQVVRLDPKGFRQRRPDGKGGWQWNLNGVRRVLYRLGDVLEAAALERPVYLVEGEKDCDRLRALGLTATTCPAGAGKWRPEYADALRDARVFILPDNDAPGAKHARTVAAALHGTAAEVRIVELPGLPEKGDASNWLDAGGTVEQLHELSQGAPLFEPGADGDLVEAVKTLTNFTRADGKREALRLPDISKMLFEHTGNWPRRVDSLLFVDDDGAVRWLEGVEHVFAWAAERMPVQWAVGSDTRGYTFTPKGELMAHLGAAAEAYTAVESLPHEPRIGRVYYAWRPPADYTPDGSHLERLLAFFDNPESAQDAALIRAMFLTPAWGGPAGTRPAFAVMAKDRGCGKSTLADAVGELYGGAVEVEPSGNEARIVERLLAPSSLLQRCVRLDNVKSAVSSGLLESLITATRISGHRLYHGDANRPNFLTWMLTGNAVRLSRDFADRSFIIRLSRPQPVTGWREEVFRFIEAHRPRILADIVHTLAAGELSGPAHDRWQSWVDGVLRRCTADAAAVVAVNQDRRNAQDDDLDEADTIWSAILTADDINWTSSGHAFIPSTQMTKLVNRALGENWSAKRVASLLDSHMEADRLDMRRERTMGARGYKVRNTRKATAVHDGSDTYDGF